MRIKIELDEEATRRLIALAVRERRPVHLQAEVIVLEALGLWPPVEQARRRGLEGGEAAGQETHQPTGGEASAH